MEKQLPSDMGAEQGLLCSCIQDTRIIGKIADIITLEHFNTPAHQDIWATMLNMYFEKKPIDLLTITSELSASKLLDGIGGEHYITHVCTVVYSSANWDEYLKTICDCYLRRKIHFAAKRMAIDALDRSIDPEELKEEASREITGMMTTKTESVHIAEVFNKRITAWEEAARSGGAINRGHDSCFHKWNMSTRGFRPQTVHIIAGRAKQGKTTAALQMVTTPAIDKKVPIGIISLEMGAGELVDKITSCHAQIGMNDLRDGKLNRADFAKVSNFMAQGMKAPIHIVDEASMTVNQFRARTRRLVVENKCEIIMLDYAQLVTPSNMKESRERQVAEISRMTKIISKELNVCVVLLAQLNEDNMIRESRTFEMDCDSLTKIMPVEESDDPYAYVLHVTHNRNGTTPIIPLKFHKHMARLEEAIVEQ